MSLAFAGSIQFQDEIIFLRSPDEAQFTFRFYSSKNIGVGYTSFIGNNYCFKADLRFVLFALSSAHFYPLFFPFCADATVKKLPALADFFADSAFFSQFPGYCRNPKESKWHIL